MLEVPGSTALSSFRIAKLLDRLTALDPGVTTLTADFVHFVDADRPLRPEETEVLRRLLTYGARAQSSAAARSRKYSTGISSRRSGAKSTTVVAEHA